MKNYMCIYIQKYNFLRLCPRINNCRMAVLVHMRFALSLKNALPILPSSKKPLSRMRLQALWFENSKLLPISLKEIFIVKAIIIDLPQKNNDCNLCLMTLQEQSLTNYVSNPKLYVNSIPSIIALQYLVETSTGHSLMWIWMRLKMFILLVSSY